MLWEVEVALLSRQDWKRLAFLASWNRLVGDAEKRVRREGELGRGGGAGGWRKEMIEGWRGGRRDGVDDWMGGGVEPGESDLQGCGGVEGRRWSGGWRMLEG